jgi:hypothetical protein
MIVERAMRAAIEARAIDDISNIVGEEWPKLLPIGRIIFEISVLYNQNVPCGGSKSGSEGGALAAVTLVKYCADRG